MSNSVFLTRVVLRNYKSIAACSVKLGPLTYLVGPNGAGKSNFLDALRLIAEALNASLDHALRERGGINEVRRRSSGHPTHFGMRLEYRLRTGTTGCYSFRVGAKKKGGFEVQEEECSMWSQPLREDHYKVVVGKLVESSFEIGPPPSIDRLYLVAAAGLPQFRPLYDALSHMGFYNLNPDEIRDLQPPDTGEILKRDGSNLASVLGLLAKDNSATYDLVLEFLSKVVEGVESVEVKHIGKKETLEFRQRVGNNEAPWRFLAENMSDGTLRALGVLTALFQSAGAPSGRIPLIGIEEPESAVHPGAAGVLRDAIRYAASHAQVLLTSHSPDLLDDKDVSDESLLAVMNIHGESKIGPVDEAERSLIRDRLFTPGELMRRGPLMPDLEVIEHRSPKQYELFGRPQE